MVWQGVSKAAGKLIEGKSVYLKYLTPDMVGERYVGWLNDLEVNHFLEVRFDVPHTLESVREFVKKNYEDPQTHFFAIVLADTNTHIGNIKVGPVNLHHKFAEVGVIIGEKSLWGKGYGAEAIELATRYAFEKLGIHKLVAGAYANNVSSIKAFEKAGYEKEAVIKNKFVCNGKYVDHVFLGKINK